MSDDWTWEKQRMSLYADSVLQGMELEFLTELADFEVGEETKAEQSPEDAGTATVTANIEMTRRTLEIAVRAWYRDAATNHRDPDATRFLISEVCNPIIRVLYREGYEKGWFDQ